MNMDYFYGINHSKSERMKTLKKIIIIVLGILALLVFIAFLLPKQYKVERSVNIRSTPEVIYQLASNLEIWHVWVPWTKEADTTAVFSTTGEAGKVGSTWEWDGEEFGNGKLTLTELVPGQLVAYDLGFDHGKYLSKGKIVIEAMADSARVSWLDEGDLGWNPLSRYMGLFMGMMMGPDFEKGLDKLKVVAEARRDWPPIDETVMPERRVIFVIDSAGPAEYGAVMAKAYGELYGFLRDKKLEQKGEAYSTYLKWDSVTMFSVMKIGIPVASVETGKGRILVETVPETRFVRAIYFGDYGKMEPAYRAMETYMKDAGMVEAGGPTELYITSPVIEKDTAKWETHILFPVK